MSPDPAPLARRLLAAALVPALAVALAASAPAQDVRRDVPFVPTPAETVARMLDLAQVKPGEFLIDLGSGDGRIAIAAAQRGARALGVDIDPQRIREANENAKKAGVTDRVEFRQENLFETVIKDADVITMYLLTTVNLKLRPRLEDELRPGTRVVSHAFDLSGWEPDVHDTESGRNVYLWIVPAKVAGQWAVKDGERSFTLDIHQSFQILSGKATIDGQDMPLRNGRMNGTQIVFTLEIGGKPETFHGRVSGDGIEGAAGPTATKQDWSATRASRG